MTTQRSIGFIGFGNLASALWAGFGPFLSEQNYRCMCYKPSNDGLPEGILYSDLNSVIANSDIIILALKPQQVHLVIDALSQVNWENRCLISLLAGTSSDYFNSQIPSLTHFIRVMPNTCAQVSESMSVISHLNSCDTAYVQFTEQLFNTAGKSLIVDEAQMNFCTALAGSGPAFLYELAKDLITLSLEQGLSQAQAETIVFQLIKGSAAMMPKAPLDSLIQSISSPNGTTVRGLETYRQLNVGKHFQDVLHAASHRAEELSKQCLTD